MATYWGTSGDDVYDGTAEGDEIDGLHGNDILHGGAGDDRIDGGHGDDILYGGDGNDYISGYIGSGSGAGAIYGGAGDDTLFGGMDGSPTFGGEGNDTIHILGGPGMAGSTFGEAGDDRIYGDNRGNVLDGGLGADRLEGRLGSDWYHIDNVGDVIVEDENAASDIDRVTLYVSYDFTSAFVEEIWISSDAVGRVDVVGNSLANTIYGNASANWIQGSGGADILVGGGGSDRLDGGTGTDGLRGGTGDDNYYVDAPQDTIAELSGEGLDRVYSAISYSLRTHVEYLYLTGTAAIDGRGNESANFLLGNGAANRLYGGSGNDHLNSLAGNDTLFGDVGNDILSGGVGVDTLQGGAGNDVFRFTAALSTGADRITDFNVVADFIQLDNAVMAGLGARTGALASTAFWKSTSGLAHDSNDRIIYDTDGGQLWYDSNGSAAGGRALIATLRPGLALTAADFGVI